MDDTAAKAFKALNMKLLVLRISSSKARLESCKEIASKDCIIPSFVVRQLRILPMQIEWLEYELSRITS